MATAAWTGLTVLLLAAAVAIHQAGHVAALTDLGVPFRTSHFHLAVHPEFTAEQAASMGFRQAAWAASGGVIASLVLGFTLLSVWCFFLGSLPGMALTAGLAIGAWAGRRWLALVLAPAAGLIVLGAEVWALILPPAGNMRALLAHSPLAAMHTAAVLSLAVALFTMLPIPALDGGRMVAATALAWRNRSAGALYARSCSWVLALVIGAAMLLVAVRLIGG